MTDHTKDNASRGATGANVAWVGAEAALENTQQANHNALVADSTVADVLANKSTATEIQLAKILVLLRQGPKTTIELREHGVMMPAARIFQLKHDRKHVITSELVTLYDANGYRHSKCARYHLITEASAEVLA